MLVILLIVRLIVLRLGELVRHDEDLLDKQLADARLREIRDQRTRALRTKLVDLRKAAEAVVGSVAPPPVSTATFAEGECRPRRSPPEARLKCDRPDRSSAMR